jgi:hypothetical protein
VRLLTAVTGEAVLARGAVLAVLARGTIPTVLALGAVGAALAGNASLAVRAAAVYGGCEMLLESGLQFCVVEGEEFFRGHVVLLVWA